MEISDTALRLITLKQHDDMAVPEQYAEFSIPEGCLDNGRIIDKQRLVSFLKTVKKAHRLEQVNLVLASSQIQTMSLSVKGAAALYIKEAVEKEFVLPAKDILYDYHAVGGDTVTTAFQVTAVPRAVSQEFLAAFKAAGIVIASLESVAHALNRALLPTVFHRTAMIVNIDRDVTTVALIANGKISQSTMFAFGDNIFTDTIAKGLSLSTEETEKIKREQGIMIGTNRAVFDAVADDCVALAHHINKTYIDWHTAHKTLSPLETMYLSGAGSVLKGLDEYLSVELRAPVSVANVWANCLSFERYVPALPQADAVRYAAVIGASLSSADSLNLLPQDHKNTLHRKHLLSVTAKVLLSFALGVAVGFVVAKAWAVPEVRVQAFALLHKIKAWW